MAGQIFYKTLSNWGGNGEADSAFTGGSKSGGSRSNGNSETAATPKVTTPELAKVGSLGEKAAKVTYGNNPDFINGFSSNEGDMTELLSWTAPALVIDAFKTGIENANSVIKEFGQSGFSKATFVVAAKAIGETAIDVGAKRFRIPGVAKSGPPRNADGIFAKVDGPTAGKKVDTATRQRMLKRDQNADGSWTCATCGQGTTNPANIHTGHIKARSGGGDLSDGNLRCEGAACNLSQGAGSAPKPGRTCAERGSCGSPYGRTD